MIPLLIKLRLQIYEIILNPQVFLQEKTRPPNFAYQIKLIINNYKYLYYKSIYNFRNFAVELSKLHVWRYLSYMADSLKKRVL